VIVVFYSLLKYAGGICFHDIHFCHYAVCGTHDEAVSSKLHISVEWQHLGAKTKICMLKLHSEAEIFPLAII
jgi:hypothetical protein